MKLPRDGLPGPDAKKSLNEGELQSYFVNYLSNLNSLKRYRFFGKMMRVGEGLDPVLAKALAIAIALQSHLLQHDDLDIGEFGTATRLELVLANQLREDAGITRVLKDVIMQATRSEILDACRKGQASQAVASDQNRSFASSLQSGANSGVGDHSSERVRRGTDRRGRNRSVGEVDCSS